MPLDKPLDTLQCCARHAASFMELRFRRHLLAAACWLVHQDQLLSNQCPHDQPKRDLYQLVTHSRRRRSRLPIRLRRTGAIDEGRLRAGNAITQRGAVNPLLEGQETCPRSPAGHWLIGGASPSGCSAEPAVSQGDAPTTPDSKARGIPGCMRVQTFKPQLLCSAGRPPSELAESHAGPR
jgi:hypothetical protein